MNLVFWDVVFVCVENDVCEDGVRSVYIFCEEQSQLAQKNRIVSSSLEKMVE